MSRIRDWDNLTEKQKKHLEELDKVLLEVDNYSTKQILDILRNDWNDEVLNVNVGNFCTNRVLRCEAAFMIAFKRLMDIEGVKYADCN